MKPPILFLVGPTAVGKSDLAVQIAPALSAEIISADSMQIYKGMDIGTAKPSSLDQRRIPHHLINRLEPSESYSAYQFRLWALEAISDIYKRGKTPLVVGGTGFYMKALIEGTTPPLSSNSAFRISLEKLADSEGLETLYQKLEALDPARAAKLNPNDKKRIIRALEICEVSGKKSSEIKATPSLTDLGYSFVMIGLNRDRKLLYGQIDLRVKKMFELGLIDEVRRVRQTNPSLAALQAVGYKELGDYLENPERFTISDACQAIQQASRNLAKRQLTWFRAQKAISWVDLDQTLDPAGEILKIYKKT